MKFKSTLLTAASGSVGGCTYSRNRFGQYIRNRSLPVNVNSIHQQAMRGKLASLVARWTSVLDQNARDAWETWAHNTPQTDKLGNTIIITGQNAYIKMNALRGLAGIAPQDTAPSIFAGSVLTPPVITTASEAAQLVVFSLTNTDAWATAVGGALLVFVSRPQNPSKLFFSGPYRYAGAVMGAVVPPVTPGDVVPPFPFVEDQRIHARFVAFQTDGRISTSTTSSIITGP